MVGQRPVAPHQRSLVRPALRPHAKKNAAPRAAIIDRQSVKCADTVGAGSSGFDAGKKIKGRKRYLLTETGGLLPRGPRRTGQRAGPGWREGPLLPVLPFVFERDPDLCRRRLSEQTRSLGAANGDLSGHRSLGLEIIKRGDQAKGFQLLPRRWAVERTFGWLMKSRRLARDYERKLSHHEAFVYPAMIGFAARRLTQ